MSGIFISYRREDSADISGRIYDRLKDRFGRDKVFKDSYSIAAGEDYHAAITRALSQVNVVLVVIGPNWLMSSRGGRVTRLQEPDDVLRIEVETALSALDTLVVPVLVGNARMPTERELPSSIRDLASRNARPVRSDPDFDRDIALLSEEIARVVPVASVPKATRTLHFNSKLFLFSMTLMRHSALRQNKFEAANKLAYAVNVFEVDALVPWPQPFEDMWRACQFVDGDVERYVTALDPDWVRSRLSLGVRYVSSRFKVQCAVKMRYTVTLSVSSEGELTVTSNEPDAVSEVVKAYERIRTQS